ncbi:MAG: recombinase family protein, partial [Micromonosporaceae bacterium]|nr:recombinase family protein [Micromonosporaceae bacterium]
MSDDAILRAGIYARVSKDKRKRQRGRSVGEQETEARAACERRRWTVAEIYKDEDRSASRFAKKERPDWERLLADLDAGQLDVLVIWEPSRGDRTL